MNQHYKSYLQSPIGILEIISDEKNILAVSFLSENIILTTSKENEISKECKKQLQEYFNGERKSFDVAVCFSGTEFQNNVWNELTKIPIGKTISYLQLAKNLGNPKCIRAAGTANGKNPIAILVPCHRVIGSDGNLIGYAGGLWRKQWLLEHEAKMINGVSTLF